MQQTPQIKAIETTYNGIRFRSRLEARWAVFMDALGVKWEYEPEGFTDGELCYLPDFWLPKLECYLEIKPKQPSEEELSKARLVAIATGNSIYIMVGPPYDPQSRDIGNNYDGFINMVHGNGAEDNYHYWATCDKCNAAEIVYMTDPKYLSCGHGKGSACTGSNRAAFAANNHRFGGH